MGHSRPVDDTEPLGGRGASPAAAPLAMDLADLIRWGEAPVLFGSKRDGRSLRMVSAAHRLDREGLAAALCRTLDTRPDVQMEIQQHDMSRRTQPASRRALLSWLRGWAYLTAGAAGQALKDAQAAVAYGPTSAARSPATAATTHGSSSSSGSGSSDSEQHFTDACTRTDGVTPSDKGCTEGSNGSSSRASCAWPAAYILLAEAQAAAGMPPEQVALTLLKAKEVLLLQQAALQSAPCLQQHQQEGAQEQEQEQERGGTKDGGSGASGKGLQHTKGSGQLLNGRGSGLLAGQVGRQLVVLQLQLVVERLDRVASALEQEAWEAVVQGGAQGLQAYLDRQAEERLPEFLRPRPKWYYYEQWMRGRIQALLGGPVEAPQAGRGALEGGDIVGLLGGSGQGPGPGQGAAAGTSGSIPEAVMAKLLATDANDLDLLLQHPLAALAQVEEYTRVLQLCGEQHLLLTHTAEPLGWDEMQALNAPAWGPDGSPHGAGLLVGLPIGADAQQVMTQARTQAMAEGQAEADPRDGPRAGSGSAGGRRLLLDCSPQGVELARRCLRLALEDVERGGGAEVVGAGGHTGGESGGQLVKVLGRQQLVLRARGLAERAGLLGAPPEGSLRLRGVEVVDEATAVGV